MSSSTAGRSVRPIANIDSKSHVNPRVQGGDDHESRMSELYDRLLQPFDDSDDRSIQDHSSGNHDDNTADNHHSIVDEDTCEHDEHCSSDEAARARIGSTPKRPSQAEVDAHMTTHLPFRSWCPHCVRGKSKGKPHLRSDAKKEIPIVVLDYMFMYESQEPSEERGMSILSCVILALPTVALA